MTFCFEAKIGTYFQIYIGHHLRFSHFRFSYTTFTIVFLDCRIQEACVAFAILLKSFLEVVIYKGLYPDVVSFSQFSLLDTMLDFWMVIDMTELCIFIAQTYSGEVMK
jgi:hypothetical protein